MKKVVVTNFSAFLKKAPKVDLNISGPVKAGSVKNLEFFDLKPLPKEAIEKISEQLDDYSEKKNDFSVW